MTQEEIDNYNCLCAEFLKLKPYVNNEKEEKWYNTCYPELYSHREAYRFPLNFPFTYEHPTIIHALYNNTKDVPVQTERICIAKMKFHSDWNWIMEVVEAIEKLGFATKIDHDYCISNYGCDRCEIDTTENALFQDEDEEKEEPISFELTKSKKESTIKAINQFLIWYNDEIQTN